MHATKIAFILSSLAGLAAVQAAPAETSHGIDPVALFKPSDDLKFIHSEIVDGQTLYWFGDDDDSVPQQEDSEPSMERRCGSNQVTCYYSHTPKSSVCWSLLQSLQSNSITVPKSPRSLCVTQSGNTCCTSWANAVSGLTAVELYNGAKAVYDQCIGGLNVIQKSGLARDVRLNGVCTTQCVSDRAKGCTN